MVNYPTQLTNEEKALRKRFAKLQEKTKELKQFQLSNIKTKAEPSPSTTTQPPQASKTVTPKDARTAAKKLMEQGKLSINKRPVKTSGFKRVGEGSSRGTVLPSVRGRGHAPSSRKLNSNPKTNDEQKPLPYKPKPVVKPSEVKQLYSRFIKPSDSIKEQKIPKLSSESLGESDELVSIDSFKDFTVYVQWRDTPGLTENALKEAFVRFGLIRDIKLKGQKNECFVTFQTPDIAKTVIKEMNKGMIHGNEVFVEAASKENGYIELPPEVEDQPWARIAAGMMDTSGDTALPVSRKRKQFQSYEQDF